MSKQCAEEPASVEGATGVTFAPPLQLAAQQGAAVAHEATFTCPYYSGSQTYGAFCSAFVTEAVAAACRLPAQTPMYLQGRIAYRQGLGVESIPREESFSGRWFSGWLTERDAQRRKPKSSEDRVYGQRKSD